jgi:hypothetical protein
MIGASWQRLLEAAFLAGLVLSGVVTGLWTHRWQPAPALDAAVAKLQRIPLTIGPWRGQALDTDPDEQAQAGLAGSTWRTYENPQLRASVSVLLVCGRPGPVSVHPPDVCFQGAGYELIDSPARYTVRASAQPAAFWTAGFAKPGAPIPAHVRVYWAWSTGDTWQAPDHPRLAFACAPVLYKLYVHSATAPADERLEEKACTEFLPLLLAELHKVLPGTP